MNHAYGARYQAFGGNRIFQATGERVRHDDGTGDYGDQPRLSRTLSYLFRFVTRSGYLGTLSCFIVFVRF